MVAASDRGRQRWWKYVWAAGWLVWLRARNAIGPGPKEFGMRSVAPGHTDETAPKEDERRKMMNTASSVNSAGRDLRRGEWWEVRKDFDG
ncbi:hypothetical protein Nepgr_032986 [Nepenthes gracilis]|uniref:Uncharacterized protein n=1 Tax=Nepenthes gracilis TaxID=150966 RepID=A0AAD3TJQ4_NEPGR|nr:hypothetical protein Nepgr_032986 [Nepenthes gracilis]